MERKFAFKDLWKTSHVFREMFEFPEYYSGDVFLTAKAEIDWWDRYPKDIWYICKKRKCENLTTDTHCHLHSKTKSDLAWVDSELYKFTTSGYKLYIESIVGDIPKGYTVRMCDGNRFNMRKENCHIVSAYTAAALDSRLIWMHQALEIDKVIADRGISIGENRSKHGNSWYYNTDVIAHAIGCSRRNTQHFIKKDNIDISDFLSVCEFVHKRNPLFRRKKKFKKGMVIG